MSHLITIAFPVETVTELREHGVKNLSAFFRQCADKELNKYRGKASAKTARSHGSTSLSVTEGTDV